MHPCDRDAGYVRNPDTMRCRLTRDPRTGRAQPTDRTRQARQRRCGAIGMSALTTRCFRKDCAIDTARDVRPVIGTRRCSKRYKRLLTRQRAENGARRNAADNNLMVEVDLDALLRQNAPPPIPMDQMGAGGGPPLDAEMVDSLFPAEPNSRRRRAATLTAPTRRSARLAARTR